MGKGRLTPQSGKFCELIASGSKTQYECYIEAYPRAANWTKASANAAASALLKKPHIQERINSLKAKFEKSVIEQYAWDKYRSTRVLMKTLEKIESNLDSLADIRNDLIKDTSNADGKLKAVNKTLYQINHSAKVVKELAGELNSMYGLNKSKFEFEGTMAQVVFEGADELPPDEEEVDNNGNELEEDDYGEL